MNFLNYEMNFLVFDIRIYVKKWIFLYLLYRVFFVLDIYVFMLSFIYIWIFIVDFLFVVVLFLNYGEY